MYVSKQDIETISQMMSMVGSAIEGGAEDEKYWFKLHVDAEHLWEKAMKSYYRTQAKRKNRTK